MDDSAVPRAVRALPWLVALVITAGIAAAVGAVQLAGVALGAYGAALVWAVALPLARAAAAKGPREHASWSMLGGLAWTTVSIGAIAITLVRATDAGEARSQIAAWIPLLAAGGIAQVFVGALAYLMPVVIGGGPQSVRTGIGTIETLSPLRLVARNVSLLALAVSMNTAVPARGAWWAVVIVTFAVDIAALGAAGVRQARAKREAIAADVAA